MSLLITGPDGPINHPSEVFSDISIAKNTKDIFTFTANFPVTWSIVASPGSAVELENPLPSEITIPTWIKSFPTK